jgi:hypothetical protein
MVARNQSVLWTELDGQVVLLNLESGRYFEVNALGSVIWRLLEEPHSVPDIVEHVVSRYRVDRERCESDLLTFLGDLSAAGLIVGRESTPEAKGYSEVQAG